MQETRNQKNHVINSLKIVDDTTIKIQFNRPPSKKKMQLARYIFKKLQYLD